MKCANDVLFINNDNAIVVSEVTDTSTGEPINTATVNVTLKDASGDNVSGQTFPLTLTYIVGSDGEYSGILQNTLALIENQVYTLITDILTANLQANFTTQITAVVRS